MSECFPSLSRYYYENNEKYFLSFPRIENKDIHHNHREVGLFLIMEIVNNAIQELCPPRRSSLQPIDRHMNDSIYINAGIDSTWLDPFFSCKY